MGKARQTGLPLESNLKKGILKYLNSLPGCFAWKAHGDEYGRAGIPDIIACYHGRFFAFEVKRPGNEPTRLQQATMGKIREAGGRVFVVNGVRDVRGIMEGKRR